MRATLREVRLCVVRNVKRLRQLRGFSQEHLDELVNDNGKHVGQVERGEVNVTLDKLTAIAAGLSTHVGELFGPAPANAQPPRVFTLTDRDAAEIDLAIRVLRRVKRSAKRRD